ncbi:subtilase-type protease inhibitor [Actinomadura madurae]|uniref:SSI family serine proteinase inhibitor n=1 Tax=Actinomadura madurae TaxID=1993 RepID=UPI002025EF22|nr:SSI family serine proteinase inhibitor [Actinomadura madurae]URM98809.1 subtilase-type protease inhibitor [Actinomadura madurae]
MPNLAAGVVVGAVVALLVAAPSGAETSLRLSVTHPGERSSVARAVTLRCDPPGGGHSDAARACLELSGSGGAFEHAPDGRMCADVYAPVIARAEGRWRGKPARFRAEYGNDCVMRSRTGSVFAF